MLFIYLRYFYALEMMAGLYANSFDNFLINKIDEQDHTYKCKCREMCVEEKGQLSKKKIKYVCTVIMFLAKFE